MLATDQVKMFPNPRYWKHRSQYLLTNRTHSSPDSSPVVFIQERVPRKGAQGELGATQRRLGMSKNQD